MEEADNLCGDGFHVCRWDDDQSVRQLYAMDLLEILFHDCFAYNAAQNNNGCGPCRGEYGVSDDMAGIGHGCHVNNLQPFLNRSCLKTGRVSHDEGRRPDEAGCTFLAHTTTGAVCCKSPNVVGKY